MTVVREIMTSDVECVREEVTLADAARKLRDFDIGSLPICTDDAHLVGMLTDRDIVVRAIADGGDPEVVTAGDLVRGEPITIGADDDVSEALAAMDEYQVRRLPVLDNEELVGILTQADVALSLSADRVGDLVEHLSEPATSRIH